MKHSGGVFLSIIILLVAVVAVQAHTYRVPVIVDTDMALDDIRALVLLFNSDMAEVYLVVTSDGSVPPATGYQNLRYLLTYFKKTEIILGAGRDLKIGEPSWSHLSHDVFAGYPRPAMGNNQPEPAAEAIVQFLHSRETRVLYLCLGPMTNLADALKIDGSIKEKISRVVYYGSPVDIAKPDWNTSRDKQAVESIINSGISIYMLKPAKQENLIFDQTFLKEIEKLDTPASHLLRDIHRIPATRKLLLEKHLGIWDEMAIIYLERPDLFDFQEVKPGLHLLQEFNGREVMRTYLLLSGYPADSHLQGREVVLFEQFPVTPALFKEDIRAMVQPILERHGLEEWKACLLTNELHRHLGVYSIVGAKMGIRARELLDAPLDSITVTSFCGNLPPLSCMNDGLQVSTGASLGRGTISVATTSLSKPAARFQYGNQSLLLTLKPEIVQKIKENIEAAIKKYGDLTPEYFNEVRIMAIQSWLELDRKEIFLESLEK